MKKTYLVPKVKTIQINGNELQTGSGSSLTGGDQGEQGQHGESKNYIFDNNI